MIALKLFRRDEYKLQWLKRVKYILDSCGLSYNIMWYQLQEISTKQCKVIIHQRIEDIALQKWNTDISTSSICKMYRIFIKKIDFENYLLHSNYRDRISLSKLRYANSKLPIYKHIYNRDSEVCTLCNLNVCFNLFMFFFSPGFTPLPQKAPHVLDQDPQRMHGLVVVSLLSKYFIGCSFETEPLIN